MPKDRQTKTCAECGETKELREFLVTKTSRYSKRYSDSCKACIAELRKEYFRHEREERRQREAEEAERAAVRRESEPPPEPTPGSPEDLVRRYESGASLRAIAQLTGLDYSAVRRTLLAQGVELRRRGRRQHAQRWDPFDGRSARELAAEMGVSPRTVERWRKRWKDQQTDQDG